MSIGSIIWAILVIVAGGLSIKENARKKAGKQTSKPAMPPFVPADAFDRSQTAGPKPKRKKRNTTPAAAKSPAAAAPRPTTTQPVPTAPQPGEIGAPAAEEQASQASTFNLRDAVIYSEILKPKFEE